MIPVLIAMGLGLVVLALVSRRQKRKELLAGLTAARPAFSVEPPPGRVRDVDRQALGPDRVGFAVHLGSVLGPRQGRPSEARRQARRSWPIHGYVGPNGSGKSAAMVWDSLPTLDAGRRVLSTVRLLDYDDPRPCEGYRTTEDGLHVPCELCAQPEAVDHRQAHPLWVPFTSWDQFLNARRCDILMDEVTGIASSRESHSMPAPVANNLVQMRRADVTIRWSSPSWARADKIIRETSQAVTYARGSWAQPSYDAEGARAWKNRRLFTWKTYDASEFEDFTVGKREQLKPMAIDRLWGPGSRAFAAYDTLDSVLSIGTVTESGSCYRCGGSRRRPACKCPSNEGPGFVGGVPAQRGADEARALVDVPSLSAVPDHPCDEATAST